MDQLTFSAIVGLAAGTLDVIPMIFKKLPFRSCVSAFLQYVFLGIIILNINLPGIPWWCEGSLIALAMTIPIAFIVSDRKSVPTIILNSIILGALISLAGHYLR